MVTMFGVPFHMPMCISLAYLFRLETDWDHAAFSVRLGEML